MKKRGLFSRSQLWFLLVVLNACLVVLGVIFLSRHQNGNKMSASNAYDSLSVSHVQTSSARYYAVPQHQPESFEFDPNEADSTQLLRLGLAPFQVRSIYRYRAKGGRFSCKDDFRRVYRLTNEQWEHLSPLIIIAKKYQLVDVPSNASRSSAYQSRRQTADITTRQVSKDNTDSVQSVKEVKRNYPVKMSGDEVLDVNSADSAQLCRVPGVGPYFAKQILRYRKQLGGYVDTKQLLQIDNFPANSLAWLVVSDTMYIMKLNVNALSTRKLMKHPYMGYYRASDIENYKRIYGKIESIETLRKMPHFSEEDIERLKPYLEFH